MRYMVPLNGREDQFWYPVLWIYPLSCRLKYHGMVASVILADTRRTQLGGREERSFGVLHRVNGSCKLSTGKR